VNNVYEATKKAALAKQEAIVDITGDGTDLRPGVDLGDPLTMLKLEKTSLGLTTALSAGGGLLKSMKDVADQLANKI
jgi:hypothetical protein